MRAVVETGTPLGDQLPAVSQRTFVAPVHVAMAASAVEPPRRANGVLERFVFRLLIRESFRTGASGIFTVGIGLFAQEEHMALLLI